MTAPQHAPPWHWIDDQARAWRLTAAVWDHDGDLFDTVAAEALAGGLEAVDRLFAALARNLVVRLRMAIGPDALDELIGAELKACAKAKLSGVEHRPDGSVQ